MTPDILVDLYGAPDCTEIAWPDENEVELTVHSPIGDDLERLYTGAVPGKDDGERLAVITAELVGQPLIQWLTALHHRLYGIPDVIGVDRHTLRYDGSATAWLHLQDGRLVQARAGENPTLGITVRLYSPEGELLRTFDPHARWHPAPKVQGVADEIKSKPAEPAE